MHPDSNLRAAALAAAAGTATTGALLFHQVGLGGALAVLPLAIGLGGLTRERTFGGFAALAGAVFLGALAWLGLVPSWAGLVAAGSLAVAIPALVRAFRYDWAAALVWVALGGFSASGGAVAVSELGASADKDHLVVRLTKDAPTPFDLAPWPAPAWRPRVEVDFRVDARPEPRCDHRRGRPHRRHFRWTY